MHEIRIIALQERSTFGTLEVNFINKIQCVNVRVCLPHSNLKSGVILIKFCTHIPCGPETYTVGGKKRILFYYYKF